MLTLRRLLPARSSTPALLRGFGALLAAGAILSSLPPTSAQAPAKKEDKAKSKKAGSEAAAAKTAVLVFPPDTKGGVTDTLIETILSAQQSQLQSQGQYRAVVFGKAMAPIRRALLEQELTPAAARAPYDDTAKAARLSKLLGYKMALVSAIADYQYDADKKQAEIVLTGRLIDFSGETPKVVRVVTMSGTGAASAANADEPKIAAETARDTTQKLMADLLMPVKPAEGEKKADEAKPEAK